MDGRSGFQWVSPYHQHLPGEALSRQRVEQITVAGIGEFFVKVFEVGLYCIRDPQYRSVQLLRYPLETGAQPKLIAAALRLREFIATARFSGPKLLLSARMFRATNHTGPRRKR